MMSAVGSRGACEGKAGASQRCRRTAVAGGSLEGQGWRGKRCKANRGAGGVATIRRCLALELVSARPCTCSSGGPRRGLPLPQDVVGERVVSPGLAAAAEQAMSDVRGWRSDVRGPSAGVSGPVIEMWGAGQAWRGSGQCAGGAKQQDPHFSGRSTRSCGLWAERAGSYSLTMAMMQPAAWLRRQRRIPMSPSVVPALALLASRLPLRPLGRRQPLPGVQGLEIRRHVTYL